MKKLIIIILTAIFSAAVSSCEKPYETTVSLAVDYSDDLGGLLLGKYKADVCYIHVTSNTDWTARLIFDGQPWAKLGMTSSSGQAWIPMAYQDNYSGEERSAIFHIEGGGKTIEFTIFQPTGSI